MGHINWLMAPAVDWVLVVVNKEWARTCVSHYWCKLIHLFQAKVQKKKSWNWSWGFEEKKPRQSRNKEIVVMPRTDRTGATFPNDEVTSLWVSAHYSKLGLTCVQCVVKFNPSLGTLTVTFDVRRFFTILKLRHPKEPPNWKKLLYFHILSALKYFNSLSRL